MATEVATQQVRPATALVHMLDNRKADFRSLMKSDQETEAFMRIVKNAVIRDPKIAEADQQTVFLECQKAATDGLVLDGREAVLNRYNTRYKDANGNWQSKTTVAYIPMIAGIKKRVRNSGLISAWNFGLVYKNEVVAGRFRFWRDDAGLHLMHEPFMPAIDGPKGDLVAAYSAVRYRDGSTDYEVMDVDQLNAIRARTSSRKFVKGQKEPGEIVGPWATDYEEMCKKTVGRRHSKNLTMSAEDRAVIERIDSQYDFTKNADEVYEAPADVPTAVKNKRTTSAADKLKPRQAEPAEDQDDDVPHTEDGEVIEPETEDGDQPNPEDAF